LLKIGKPIPAVDAVIAAFALNNGLKLITEDRRFLFVKEIKEEFNVDVK
jgi:predicted nucleic acid-binding protein